MSKTKDWADWQPEKNAQLFGADPAPQGHVGTNDRVRKPAKPFNYFRQLTADGPSREGARPDCAQLRPVVGIADAVAHFVPVSFVAKDWNVTPRRIRALLTVGRLAGRQQDNGYWEVQYPYLFALGTRGPSLKRQKRPPKRPRLVVDNTAGKSA